MKAYLKNYRQAPRKVRLIADFVRGKDVAKAISELTHVNKRAAFPFKKLIESAAANAKEQGIDRDRLLVKEVQVDATTYAFSTKDLTDPFLLETNYVYFNKAKTNTINDYFWIDFVDANQLKSFLQILEPEVKAILNAMSFLQLSRQNQARERSNPGL